LPDAAASPARCAVLHVTWLGTVGGIERQLATVVPVLARADRAAHLVCFLDGRGPIADGLAAQGLAVRLGLRRGFSPIGLWRFARLLRLLRPDVLHFHTEALAAHLVSILALPGAARVYTAHHPDLLARSPKTRAVYALLRRSCSGLVALSPGMARVMAERGVDPRRIAVIPNASPIPQAVNGSARAGAPAVVGFVGRLVPEQRLELFVDVVAELRRRGVECRGLIVGDGPARAALERHVEARGLSGLVELAGERLDVVPALDRMTVFLSTRARAVFGIALLEAMARCVPVVAFPCEGGLSELAAEGGVLLRDRDVTAAADATAALLESPEERARVTARGTAVAAAHAPEAIVSRLLSLYADVRGKGERAST
jgi:glycosyltransferase involved in cell wall biosynthesis